MNINWRNLYVFFFSQMYNKTPECEMSYELHSKAQY